LENLSARKSDTNPYTGPRPQPPLISQCFVLYWTYWAVGVLSSLLPNYYADLFHCPPSHYLLKEQKTIIQLTAVAMLKPRRLLRGEITYSEAKGKEVNILHKLAYWKKQIKFFSHLSKQRSLIQAVTAHHLGVNPETCRVSELDNWFHGSFNLCIPIIIGGCNGHPGKRVIIRFPLPYRVGEARCPGNADEKLRCEAGAYAWLQENCPTVPIPHLYGFGLTTGQSVRTEDASN
jgi:hypothetical protein